MEAMNQLFTRICLIQIFKVSYKENIFDDLWETEEYFP